MTELPDGRLAQKLKQAWRDGTTHVVLSPRELIGKAVLLRRVFLVDVLECPTCGGRMKIIAAVTRPASVQRILEHLGLPSEAPELHPARPPPQLEMEREPAEAEDFHADPPGPDW